MSYYIDRDAVYAKVCEGCPMRRGDVYGECYDPDPCGKLLAAFVAAEEADKPSFPRWISVTERLPEREGEYLCIYGFELNGEIHSFTFKQVLRYYLIYGRPHFQHEGAGDGMRVLWWQEIAPDPKEGEA